MRYLRIAWLAAGVCLLALAAGLLSAGRGSAASPTKAPLLRPDVPKLPAPPPQPRHTTPAPATTVQRTFVSTSGSDSDACTATAPCRSFGTALSKTSSGGEVVALTSGGYGPVSIGQAVTLVGAPGVDAAITATSGDDAVLVNAGSSDAIVLRNLTLNGLGSGQSGVHFLGGASLQLENIAATGFMDGFEDQNPGGSLSATNVEADGNDYGIVVNNGSGSAPVVLDGVVTKDNSSAGIFLAFASTRVNDCISSGNGTYGVEAESATMVSGCQLSNNSSAGLVDVGATVQVSGSTVTHNAIGLGNVFGTLQSFGDNLVAANTTNTAGTITTIGKT